MIRDIVFFEWRYHTRQISFAAAVLTFFALGFALTGTGFGPDNIHIDSPYTVAESVGVLSLVSVFVLAAFCANAVVRDREFGMEEMVFTTSVGKLPFLAGRFTGSFAAAFTAFSASIFGMVAARFMPWQEADRLGAFDLVPYLWALLIVALPNILFAAVLLFAVATVTRNVLASYAASVVLYVLYFIASSLTNSPLMAASVPGGSEGGWLAAVLDPFALSAFFEQTQHWTAAERNTRLLSLSGNLLLNRVTWIAAAFAGLAIVHRRFDFRVLSRSSRTRRAHRDEDPSAALQEREPLPVATELRDNLWQSYLSATKLEIRAFLLSGPFLALGALWAGLATSEIVGDITRNEYGSALHPAAGVLFRSIGTPLSFLGSVLLVYFGAEIVWRERTLRMAPLLHATKARNAVFVLSKWTVLAALVGILTGIGVAVGIAIQISRGYPVDAAAWLGFAWLAAAPLLLLAAIAIAIQTLVPHKYAGMLLVLLVLVAGQRGEVFGLDHPLVRFASASPFGHSDLNGFGFLGGFHWSLAYWASLTGLLLVAAAAQWRPGKAERVPLAIPAALTVAFLSTGGLIFYNANILGAYTTSAELLDWKADYERTYRPWTSRAQPRIAAVRARVDLHPESGSYRVRGQYDLVNEDARPISEVLIAVRREAKNPKIELAGARSIRHDARFDHYAAQLDPPLRTGGRVTLRFDISVAGRDFFEAGSSVVENGSWLMSFRAFPTIGYRTSYEIEDPRERRRRGLASRSAEGQPEIEAREWIDFDLTVSTAPDQIAIAPGRLVREWREGGRRVFRYRADAPILNQFGIASARYSVRKERHRDIAVEIYSHPSHAANLDRIARAAKDSLSIFESSFGPYPHPYFRIVEVPSSWNFGGFATPGMVVLRDTGVFLIDARDPDRVDLVYRRVAHEVAHQWWGYTLVAADAPGGATLTESLTKYSELLVLERVFGRRAVRELLTYELDRYLTDRTSETATEPPLMHAQRQAYLYYRKGAIVMYAIRDLIGEQAMHSALRALVRKHGGPRRQPTTAHLLAELQAAAPVQHHALINQWLGDVVLYDLKLESAVARKRSDGRYEVAMRITASKQREAGPMLPMSEAVPIALFSADHKPLATLRPVLRSGTNDVTIVVSNEPALAAVDPDVTRIDRNRRDNWKTVGAGR